MAFSRWYWESGGRHQAQGEGARVVDPPRLGAKQRLSLQVAFGFAFIGGNSIMCFRATPGKGWIEAVDHRENFSIPRRLRETLMW